MGSIANGDCGGGTTRGKVLRCDTDGAWQRFNETEEWIVKNQPLTVGPGSSDVAAQIPFALVGAASPTAMKIALTRAPIPE